MKIGSIELKNNLILAPMAGVTDLAFRSLAIECGADYAVTEMVSAKAMSYDNKKTFDLLKIAPNEKIKVVQIFGDEPDTMAEMCKVLEKDFDIIDINMGCPAPKIAGNGGGSALLKDSDLAERIMKSVRKAVDIPVTVKIRLGWDSDSINCVDMAKRAESAGMDAITVHGRTRMQMYAPPVDRQMIAEVKKNVSIPVIANGDIVDGISAAKMIEETNCDYIMVGRGALGRPWVFSQINAYLKHESVLPEPPVSERMRVMVRHIKLICEYKGERVGIKEARKHAAWYIKGIHGAAAYRQQVGTLSSIEQLEELAYKITVENL